MFKHGSRPVCESRGEEGGMGGRTDSRGMVKDLENCTRGRPHRPIAIVGAIARGRPRVTGARRPRVGPPGGGGEASLSGNVSDRVCWKQGGHDPSSRNDRTSHGPLRPSDGGFTWTRLPTFHFFNISMMNKAICKQADFVLETRFHLN